MYDDEVRKWVGGIGVGNMGKKLVNSKDGPVTFEKPAMTIEKLMSYGFMLVQEQENVKRVQLAESYLSSAALGDANDDAIKQGTFYGKPFVEQAGHSAFVFTEDFTVGLNALCNIIDQLVSFEVHVEICTPCNQFS